MKILLLCLLTFPLWGLSLGDPALSHLIDSGILCDRDFPISWGLGLTQEDTYQAHLKVATEDRGSVSETDIQTTYAKISTFAWDMLEWDILLGTGVLHIGTSEKPFITTFQATLAPMDLYSSTGFYWGTEVIAALYKNEFLTLGISSGYSELLTNLNVAEIADRLYLEENSMRYREWSVAAMQSFFVDIIPTKLSVSGVLGVYGKWKRFSVPNVAVSSIARLFNMENERWFGYYAGGNFLLGGKIYIGFERRFLAESSNVMSAFARF